MPSLIELLVRLCLAPAAVLPFIDCNSVRNALQLFLNLQEYQRIGIVACAYLATTALMEIVRLFWNRRP
jgi:hypothetical protein